MNQRHHLKTFSLRAALMLLVMLLTATTAWGQQPPLYLTLNPNYEGAGSDVIPVNFDYTSGKYQYSLTNFNPAKHPQFIRDGHYIVGWPT